MTSENCKVDTCPDNCPAHSGMVVEQVNSKAFIDEIRTNHLPHIQTELENNAAAITDNQAKNLAHINKNHSANQTWLIGILVSVVLLLLATGVSLLAG